MPKGRVVRLNALTVMASWLVVSVAFAAVWGWFRRWLTGEYDRWHARQVERRYAREVAALREVHDRVARPEPTGELRRRLSRQAMRRSVPFDVEVDG